MPIRQRFSSAAVALVAAVLASACTSPFTDTAPDELAATVTATPAESSQGPTPTASPTPPPVATLTPVTPDDAEDRPAAATPLRPPTATPAAAQPSTDASSTVPPGLQEAVVTWIIDGDTIDVEVTTEGEVPPGDQRIRLLEIDTPERDDDCYETATDLLADLIPVGSTVFLERDVENLDPNGRYLRYIWSETEGLVNVDMVAEGMAEAFIFPLNRLHEREVLSAEEEAQDLRLGIWGSYCDGRR